MLLLQVAQGCGLNSNRPPLLVFAVMVNPDILKQNGKNAASATVRLVTVICSEILIENLFTHSFNVVQK